MAGFGIFPVYIWVIVGFLVYISQRSVTMTKLLGSSPVPVLATLFLLSYAKLLRTIIAALTLTVLRYPCKNVIVWIHDANVSLAKYIPLVLVAVLFLLFLFLPYTLLLLLVQVSPLHLILGQESKTESNPGHLPRPLQAKASILDWVVAFSSLRFVSCLCLQQ